MNDDLDQEVIETFHRESEEDLKDDLQYLSQG